MSVNSIIKWGAVAIVAAAGGGGLWYSLSRPEGSNKVLRTVTASRGDFVSKVQATGTLEPQELVDVGAQVTGEIKEFGTDVDGKRVDYGSEVKAGQLLARIDDTIVELDIQKAEAQVAQAKAQILTAAAQVAQAKATIEQQTANLNKASRDLTRARKLGVGDALSQADFDNYTNAFETAQANLAGARAQLASAEAGQKTADAQLLSAEAQYKSQLRNRDYTHITAPVDGTIVVRQVNVGQTVVSSMNATTLFLVARDLSKMQIWASVNEADIAKVIPGQEVRYTVDALPNEEFKGYVNKIRPNATMSSNVVTYIVEIDIDNPERKLLPYMSANANFIVKEVKNALMVPESAFNFEPEEAMVQRPQGEHPRIQRPEPGDEEGESAATPPAMLWKKVDDTHVSPVLVRKMDSDGTRAVIEVLRGRLEEGDELATGVTERAEAPAAAAPGSNNLFGPKRPERRQRGTGGAEAKPGQSAGNDRPGPPPM
ncbi:MAG: efflux RND transporter periplasmic adaptor subunit [Akkermansia sp.]